MFALIAKILLGKQPPAPKTFAGARVNLCDPFMPQKLDGIALSEERNGMVYVEWARGGSGWEPASKLSFISE